MSRVGGAPPAGTVKVAHLEPYVSWEDLGRHLGGSTPASKRWLEQRVAEGMPSTIIHGCRCFQIPRAVAWLDEHGYMEDTEAA